MTTNEATKESEFVLRRLGDSFPQFMMDFWESVPLFVLVPTVLIVAARFIYGRYYRKTHPHAKPDKWIFYLGWASILSVAAGVIWVLVSFYQRDTQQMKAGGVPQSTLGTSNAALWYALVFGVFGLGSVFVVLMYIKDHRSI